MTTAKPNFKAQDKEAIAKWEQEHGFNSIPKLSKSSNEEEGKKPISPKACSTTEVNKYISLAKQINNNNSPLESSLDLIHEAYGEILIDFSALMQLKLAEFEFAITVPSKTYPVEKGYKPNDYDSIYDAWIDQRIEFWDSFTETLRGWAKLTEGLHMSGFTHGCVSTLLDLANLFDAVNALEPKESIKE